MALLRTARNGSVKVVEQGVGKPVVFLHSGVGSAGEWRGVFSNWPSGFRLIAVVTFRGASGPGVYGHYPLDDFADQVDAVAGCSGSPSTWGLFVARAL